MCDPHWTFEFWILEEAFLILIKNLPSPCFSHLFLVSCLAYFMPYVFFFCFFLIPTFSSSLLLFVFHPPVPFLYFFFLWVLKSPDPVSLHLSFSLWKGWGFVSRIRWKRVIFSYISLFFVLILDTEKSRSPLMCQIGFWT